MASVIVVEIGDYVITKDPYCYSTGRYARDKETGEYVLDKKMNKTVRGPRYHVLLVQALARIYEHMLADKSGRLNDSGNTPETLLELRNVLKEHDAMFKKLVSESFKK
jgi:hypothetical protein